VSKTPRSLAAATKLLEEHADLTSRVEIVEADRAERVDKANAWADLAKQPMLARIEAIGIALETWWNLGGSALADGKKSMELGGCVIGSRKSRPKLAHGFESDAKATEALLGTRFAKHTTRVSYSLDRTGTLKLLQVGGKTAATIASLGFSIEQGERFYVERSG
jgi:hypothetical protein